MTTVEATRIESQAGPQSTFLSTSADIAIYGGAAGGGKTWALLMEPLRHVNNPQFGAVIFRRTYPEITNEGGMWDESQKLYSLLDAKPNASDLQWTFPSGAKITFAHMQLERDRERWKGAQIPLIEFDQLESFTAGQWWYMFSRNRSVCGVRPYIRATANPEPGWLAEFLAWWIGEDGYAIPERSGKVRWMVRENEEVIWADTAEELRERFPDNVPNSVTFILSTIYDNKILMERDPAYLAKLKALPLVERERLLGDSERGGNWHIKPAAGKVFNRAWFEIVDAAPAGGRECRFWDFAATEKKLAGDDPDFTAGVKIREVNGVYYVMDSIAVQAGPAEVDRLFVNTSRQDSLEAIKTGIHYMVRWEIEPGSAGIRENRRLVQMLAGIDAAGRHSTGDKLTRAKALAAQAEAGNVKLLKGPWNERWLAHMHGQPDLPHDDEMDGSAGSFNELTAGSGRRAVGSYQG